MEWRLTKIPEDKEEQLPFTVSEGMVRYMPDLLLPKPESEEIPAYDVKTGHIPHGKIRHE